MQNFKTFFWHCSGADLALLRRCPTESSKYVGIGATIFFTGFFAALSAGYALYTVFDSSVIALMFGLIWGLMIFNLDRYIVSSMKKEGRWARQFAVATPRILLALLISIVIARPLELKIFEKEIEPELIVMEQETYERQEKQVRLRFSPMLDSLKSEVNVLKSEITTKVKQRDELVKLAQEEADGTGGSRHKNLGPIYKVKKANADAAEQELLLFRDNRQSKISMLEKRIAVTDSIMLAQFNALEKTKINGLAARMEALSRITNSSQSVAWAHWFILLLFIAVETAPVFVKLISGRGPYDNLLRLEEYPFIAQEIETCAKINSDTKGRVGRFSDHEKNFVSNSLDAKLGNT